MTEMAMLVTPLLDLHRWTVNDFHQIIAAGVLDEDDRIELINGVITQMSPMNARHGGCINRMITLLRHLDELRYIVTVRNPVNLLNHSEIYPDLAIARFRADFYATSHPTAADILVVIEVADTTLRSDRRVKAPLYAGAGIPEYWIVALNEQIVEQYCEPSNNAYQTMVQYQRDQTLQSTSISELQLAVNAIVGSP